ncbi:hypothetical protein TOL_1322 [Thalassolituus oleivorans MIL-1]|uniref:Uncharacterized protein n=1 Tax=Thalassolituus oleivorans MIL-1 TaxID=1298593 RepID=M5DRF4_9GAMM|nr:hypothetical protein TOL_1322 [Thalassolituus oleivorans MIL-1]
MPSSSIVSQVIGSSVVEFLKVACWWVGFGLPERRTAAFFSDLLLFGEVINEGGNSGCRYDGLRY